MQSRPCRSRCTRIEAPSRTTVSLTRPVELQPLRCGDAGSQHQCRDERYLKPERPRPRFEPLLSRVIRRNRSRRNASRCCLIPARCAMDSCDRRALLIGARVTGNIKTAYPADRRGRHVAARHDGAEDLGKNPGAHRVRRRRHAGDIWVRQQNLFGQRVAQRGPTMRFDAECSR